MAGKLFTAVVCLKFLIVALAAPPQQSGNSTAVLLQGFHWNSANYKNPNWYSRLTGNVEDLANLGITHVWLAPPSDSGAPEGYLPRQLNILSSSYGSADDLSNLLNTFKSKGITAVADIVVNHRVGTTDMADFTNPEWSLYSIVNDDECRCGQGNPDSGIGFYLGRDLDHQNVDEVQNGYKKWLTEVIKSAGFNGIRFDYIIGLSPQYFGMYANAMNPDFCVGETWYQPFNFDNIDENRQKIVDWIDGTGQACGAFDFTTKGILNNVLNNDDFSRLRASDGKPQGVIGWWPSHAVTFVDNHDTGGAESCGTGQSLWPLPCDKVMQGYAYILTHPGIPTIFYPHVYDWNLKAAIGNLTKVRRDAGITSTSHVDIQEAKQGLYAAIINGKKKQVAMKLGPNDWTPGSDWNLETAGVNFAVWTK